MICRLSANGYDADNRGRTPPPDANAKRWGKDGARAMMTPKEKLKVHAEIERTNREKLEAWRQIEEERGGEHGGGSEAENAQGV
jgi:hypothetical protein